MRHCSTSKRRADKGWTLVVTLIGLTTASALLAMSMRRSTQDTQMAGSWAREVEIDNLAEEGLNVRIAKLRESFNAMGTTSVETWVESVIDDHQEVRPRLDIGPAGSTVKTYVLHNPKDALASTDVIRVRSVAAIGEISRAVEAVFRVSKPNYSMPTGPLEMCHTPALPFPGRYEIHITGGDSISADNTDPPSYATCSGSGGANCAGSSGTPPAPGDEAVAITYNPYGPSLHNPAPNANFFIDRDPVGGRLAQSNGVLIPITRPHTGFPRVERNRALPCASIRETADAAYALADTTMIVSTNNTTINAGTPQIRSQIGRAPNNCQVFAIHGDPPGNSVTLNGNIYGCGVLVIDDVDVKFAGSFTFAGVVVIKEGASVAFVQDVGLYGTARIFGTMMTASPAINLNIQGRAEINWSEEAIGYAEEAFIGSRSEFEPLAWRSCNPGSDMDDPESCSRLDSPNTP